jgi:hypothetical protein
MTVRLGFDDNTGTQRIRQLRRRLHPIWMAQRLANHIQVRG